MKKQLAASISLAVATTVAPYINAAGLGDVKLMSALNQPLRAEIRLRNVDDLSEGELLVNLASLEGL